MSWWRRAFGARRRAPEDADEALRAALLAVLDRDLAEAERLLTDAVQQDSSGFETYLALARFYRMRGEVGRAIRVHQNLLLRKDLSPDQTLRALLDLAQDFRSGGFLQRAIASYEEVLAHDSRNPTALRALVSLFQDVRSYDRAIEARRRLPREEREAPGVPSEAELLLRSAETAQAEGRSDDARKLLRRALRKDDGLAQGWLLLGEIESDRGRTKAALAAWQRVPGLDPRIGRRVYPRLEAGFAAAGKSAEYESFLEKQIEERPGDREPRLALARALAARGAADEALAALRAALELDPDDPEPLVLTGRILLSAGRDGEAAKAHAELLDVLERQRPQWRREDLS